MEVHCWKIGWMLAVCLAAAIGSGAALTCDWKGSGLAHGTTGHVTVVSLGCGAGRVQWRYPQGALRVALDPSDAFDFRACLRVEAGSRGARIFVETHRRLQLLWAEDDGLDAGRWRCFVSRGGAASLFLEAPGERADPLVRSGVSFEYDAQPTESDRLWDDLEDCRPCTDSEVLLSYCTSDFVVRGQITGVEHHDRLDRSALLLSASRVIRQTNDIFRTNGELTFGDAPAGDLSNHVSDRYRPAVQFADSAATADTAVRGRVYVPRHCGAHSGRAQYLLMGRHRLGVPMVTCSLAVDEWRRIRAAAERSATNECVLET
ncbi:meteorin-like protein [Pollicipes pollicipes]|uniref:meteorin-like protein n=1 Tax=Pollicipes pollicipes TaxID=41117 RepID=UPI0018853986|nr:meteorin-like protein [Pollicipes pollicipes]